MDLFGAALAVTRGLQLAATLSVFGTLTTLAWVAPAGNIVLRSLVVRGVVVALLTIVPWLATQSIDMASAGTVGELVAAMPTVLFATRFGHTLLLRAALLGLVLLLLRGSAPRTRLAVLPAGIAAALQAWIGHPGASEDALLVGAAMLHVVAAGAWLGGLLPLLLLIRDAPAASAARAAERFGWIGIVAVLTLTATALAQGWALIGGYVGLAATAYGQLALLKLLLFAVLLALAAINRVRLTPALATSPRARRHILSSIGVEIGIGLLVVLAASWLGTLTPAAHAQPEWPFALRPNVSILVDPDVRRAFIVAAAALAVAVALLGRGLLVRRWRWMALAGVPLLAYYAAHVVNAAPFLDPMLIPAYPSTFYHSPSGFTPASILRGAALFGARCAVCHGAEGHGDGKLARQMPIKPANLVAEHVWGHSDGELFWWLSNGIDGPKGEPAMPAFASVLPEDDRWALIDYLHAHLAGTAMAAGKRWRNPVTPPALEATCGEGSTFTLDDLRGRFVRIVTQESDALAVPRVEVVTVLLQPQPASGEGPGCVADGSDSWAAYAQMAGVPPAALTGTQFLIDPAGWLRAGMTPGTASAWLTADGLGDAMRDATAHPMAAGGHHHH
jgi:putative copper export protein/mono/diheme cytochrome c family protein